MCSQYTVKSSSDSLSDHFSIAKKESSEVEFRALPYGAAIVVLLVDGLRQFRRMSYSLVPSWSKEPKVKFATHNARIETLTEKPSWKEPLASKRCLVPVTQFVESIVEGKYAGNMMKFSEINNRILVAAGLWDVWVDPVSGKRTESFAIITDEPPAFVLDAGHDRCPVFLKPGAWDSWLDPNQKSPVELIKILKENQEVIEFKVEVDRPLKAGWEKRI